MSKQFNPLNSDQLCDPAPNLKPSQTQHFAALVIVNSKGTIKGVSENLSELFVSPLLSPQHLLNKPIESLLSAKLIAQCSRNRTKNRYSVNPVVGTFQKSYKTELTFSLFYTQENKNSIYTIMPRSKTRLENVLNKINTFNAILLNNASLTRNLKNFVKEIRSFTQYDRVLLYKFDENFHGEVIAESSKKGLEEYLGLRFPATDVPLHVRELYTKYPLRIVANVKRRDSTLVYASDFKAHLNLLHSPARPVHEVHKEYMTNMGISSSFSLPILIKGQLWGLLSCHKIKGEEVLDFNMISATRILLRNVQSILNWDHNNLREQTKIKVAKVSSKLIADLPKSNDLRDLLHKHLKSIHKILKAQSVFIKIKGNTISSADVPDQNKINQIILNLKKHHDGDTFYSDHIKKSLVDINLDAIHSGILAISLSGHFDDYIIWFRSEMPQIVKWAGNPFKRYFIDENKDYHPRNSFKVWKEQLHNYSEKWTDEDLFTAKFLRSELLKIMLDYFAAHNKRIGKLVKDRTNLLNQMNIDLKTEIEKRELITLSLEEHSQQLKQSNLDLELFAKYIAHDLRNPIYALKLYTQIIEKHYGSTFSANHKRLTKEAYITIQNMNKMINVMLDYAKINSSHYYDQNVDLNHVIKETKYILSHSIKTCKARITCQKLPIINANKTLLIQLFQNIISNAIKFCKNGKPEIKILYQSDRTSHLITISDNGIGINRKEIEKIFDLFERSSNASSFEGHGLGLSICRKIVQIHNGRIWVSSRQNKGSNFYISFPKDN